MSSEISTRVERDALDHVLCDSLLEIGDCGFILRDGYKARATDGNHITVDECGGFVYVNGFLWPVRDGYECKMRNLAFEVID